MEQLDVLSSLRIDRGEIWALVGIAIMASQGKICRVIAAQVLSRNQVFNVQGEDRLFVLMKPAVLATSARPRPDKVSLCSINHAAG